LTHDEKEEFDKINAEIERTNTAKANSQKALDDFEKELDDKNIKIFDVPQLKEKWHQLIEMNIRKYSENISANAKLNGFKYRCRSVHLSD
jgi:predicted  nucleic acid-binding Zn-ribbon protein